MSTAARKAIVSIIREGKASSPTAAATSIAPLLQAKGYRIEARRELGRPGLSCSELLIGSTQALDLADLSKTVSALAGLGEELIVQDETSFRRRKRLLVMDIDSTFIEVEVVDELAKLAGIGAQVAAITERAMRGEIDFDQSLTKRVSLLAGLHVKDIEGLKLPLTPGAQTLVRAFRAAGGKVALVSGGFSIFGEKLKAALGEDGIDELHTNVLEIEGGKLTGKLLGPIVNGARKAELLGSMASRYGIPLEETVAIGDGANDIPMIRKAGLGIAFCAKPKTREAAPIALNIRNLSAVLFLLGMDLPASP